MLPYQSKHWQNQGLQEENQFKSIASVHIQSTQWLGHIPRNAAAHPMGKMIPSSYEPSSHTLNEHNYCVAHLLQFSINFSLQFANESLQFST